MKARVMGSFMIWLVAVVSVAAIAWLAIGTAGRQVTADPIAAPLPTEFPPTPSPTRTSAPTRTPIEDDVSPTSGQAGPTATRSTGAAAPTTAARPSATGSRSRFSPVTTTYNTAAGRLRVRCEGRRITLDGGYAQPAPGWAVSVQSGGPDRIQVTFDTGKTPPITVVAECGGGRPRFHESASPEGKPPTTGGGRWHFTQQTGTPVPTTTTWPTAAATCPPPSLIGTVTPTPEATVSATPTPAPTSTAPPTSTACAPVTVTSPPAARPWAENWVEREWAQRTR